ncbi:rhomboid family intramembrane serine protease [Anabaena subtropica]|uniref:Rhomboid family intramembrane serine protease n=1 Tax=Anabaena subtropica FACHB-260 TaxID=2692884 RepID=A0ABR8CMA5_9NOST|nr:rhomboid family intramembrane serine protease [Anabaena subtropica]MBD2344154.1 rhomboid family intramembrane serine protease [Anabaena subtropica FACHB-260]
MVPLRDNNPTTITPYVTYGLIAANILVFLYQLSLSPQELQGLFQIAALVPCQISDTCPSGLSNPLIPEWLTLVTSQFLHGGFLHLAGNMLFLWVFGNNIEDKLGHIKYLIFYLLCGVLAALSQWFFSQNSTIPALGASGAIAGVLGAYIFRFPKSQILTLIPLGFFWTTIRLPALFFLGFWFFQQAFYGIASLQARSNIGMESGGVAYWAHAGGFVFGVVLAPLFGLYKRR